MNLGESNHEIELHKSLFQVPGLTGILGS